MPFNTATVGTAVTPAVVQTFISHVSFQSQACSSNSPNQYLNRKPRAQKPTAHISYDEGLHLIRKFLLYASHHTVEDIQSFTAQWVPHPTWVKVDEVKIPEDCLKKSAEAIQAQLSHHGIEIVGGKAWWQWRRPQSEMKAEWIEMRSDYNERKKGGNDGKRVMLYVHGGAYFFGSVDEHRYQMQRHARKLKARVFAPRYRLAPQFPFPCGLHDCLAAYLYLLTVQDPSTIVLAGDSAGGGMVLSMMVVMRDQGIPLPAGAILISPWVDLTHSFPSVAGDNPLDYIPPHGFHQRPSPSWPPPNTDDMLAMEEDIIKKLTTQDHVDSPHNHQAEVDAVQGFHVNHHPDSGTHNDTAATGSATNDGSGQDANTVPGAGHDLSIMIDGNLVEIKDQVQMYASNQLISHPLVSPILQPSLGGLPPLLIMVGGGEMLRDEQIYLAHKAANPAKYPPGDAFLDVVPHDHARSHIDKWKPTDVQLQVWDDLCHVAPTLSFTRPAKYMYRSIAQFGAWTLARAQKTQIEILDDDDVSVISKSESDDEKDAVDKENKANGVTRGQVGRAGDPMPHFKDHMIRQRVDRHGNTYSLEPESELPGCNVSRDDIGVIKQAPMKKWMSAKKEWDTKFASSKRRVQKQRAREFAQGYQQFGGGEVPPPSALAGRRKTGEKMEEPKKTRSMGMSLWALWGSKHDEKALELEKEANRPDTVVASAADGQGSRASHDTEEGKDNMKVPRPVASRSRSRRKTVTDEHQTDDEGVDENTPVAQLLAIQKSKGEETPGRLEPNPPVDGDGVAPTIFVHTATNENEGDDFDRKRPKAGGIAFPFSLANHEASASMTTLMSTASVPPTDDVRIPEVKESGNTPESNGRLPEDKAFDDIYDVVKGADVGKGKGVAVESGEVVGSERPPLETFKTAMEVLPK